jgi:rfaE bifunctional protein nucleotidyltransferase chain/domain
MNVPGPLKNPAAIRSSAWYWQGPGIFNRLNGVIGFKHMESYRKKIKTLEKAKQEIEGFKASGKKTVFTNGCFDILHPGHTRYLCDARGLGDRLIVAVNSDRSVRAVKGPERPVRTEQTRAEMLAALGCVDTVIIFDEDNPKKVIQYLLPDILVKGGDWAEDEIIGSDVVKAAGGEVKRIPFVAGFSTTDLIEKIRKLRS